jgi:hypothetical protein
MLQQFMHYLSLVVAAAVQVSVVVAAAVASLKLKG